ncbi:MAG: hypothetical protein ACF8NJ_03610, partial [Phycisphaerales bacterium JB038]
RCAVAHMANMGTSHCQSCGLRIYLEVEEPRCACGYLLYQLQGDRCPECGRLIPWKDRWAGREEEAPPPDAAP